MNDKLKQFIRDNRDEFDRDDPDPEIFHRLRDGLDPKRAQRAHHGRILKRLAIAAAIVITLGSLAMLVRRSETKPDSQPGSNVENTGFPDPSYAREIEQYQQMINLQQSQLKQVANDHPELYQQFSEDINQLDSAYQALKKTLDTGPNSEVLLEAMIKNLQWQTELLNRQLLIIKEIKQKSKT